MKEKVEYVSFPGELLDLIACPTCFTAIGCDTTKCSQECIKVCKEDAITLNKEGEAQIDKKKCSSCSVCTQYCPIEAIQKPGLTLLHRGGELFLGCRVCKTVYPIKYMTYITPKCIPSACLGECVQACPEKALHFKESFGPNPKRLVKTYKCTNCANCTTVCPLDAIVSVKTPILLPREKNEQSEEVESFADFGESPEIPGKQPPFPDPPPRIVPAAQKLTFDHLMEELKRAQTRGPYLDCGCGSNSFKVYIKQKLGLDFTGTDAVVDAHVVYPLQFISDGQNLPIKNGSISVCTSNFVLEHTADPERYLREIMRVLNKEGKFLLSVPTQHWHLAYLLSVRGWIKYLHRIMEDPSSFLKNPVKHFIYERAHEKDWITEGIRRTTVFDEMSRWNTRRWEKMITGRGFAIENKKTTGNILSLDNSSFIKKIGNSEKSGVHITYTLSKKGR